MFVFSSFFCIPTIPAPLTFYCWFKVGLQQRFLNENKMSFYFSENCEVGKNGKTCVCSIDFLVFFFYLVLACVVFPASTIHLSLHKSVWLFTVIHLELFSIFLNIAQLEEMAVCWQNFRLFCRFPCILVVPRISLCLIPYYAPFLAQKCAAVNGYINYNKKLSIMTMINSNFYFICGLISRKSPISILPSHLLVGQKCS